jgi:O-succinylbenzoic acid--CoA ligase
MWTSDYPYTHIWINGRNVSLKDIAEQKAFAETDFEQSTFLFIGQWLTQVDEFSINTSGSTGEPKTISITREQMIASALQTQQALGLMSGYHALICLDARYIAGRMMIVRSFVSHMKMFALDPCANPLIKIPLDINIHFTAMVPYQIKAVLESKHPHLFNNLLTILIGGSAISDEIKQQLKSFSCRCIETYGMTETISHVALRDINEAQRTGYFKLLPGISMQTDERGCLVLNVPYLKEKLITNDIVEFIDDTSFNWLGRADNVINSGGVKVIPEKLEKDIAPIFKCLNINSKFFIAGIPDHLWGNKVILVIEDGDPNPYKIDSLKELLIQSLPAVERPKEMWISPSLVYTENGKINRRKSLENVSLNITISK